MKINMNENLETLHLSRTRFYPLPGSQRKTGFLRDHPLSVGSS